MPSGYSTKLGHYSNAGQDTAYSLEESHNGTNSIQNLSIPIKGSTFAHGNSKEEDFKQYTTVPVSSIVNKN